jgi:hypothetical protein
MRITSEDEARAVALITHDVEATLGSGQESVIRDEASTHRAFFNEPDTIELNADEYLEKVAEEVQQYFHDCFVDITWPACPFHRRHPLWLHDGAWVCEQLHAPVAPLGELRASRDPAGGYVIVADHDP